MKKSLDTIVEALNLGDFIHSRKTIGDEWELITKKLAYFFRYFKKLEDYSKPKTEVERKTLILENTRKNPSDEKKARIKKSIQNLNLKTSRDPTMVYCKSDTILLADTLLEFQKISIETYRLDSFFINLHLAIITDRVLLKVNMKQNTYVVKN